MSGIPKQKRELRREVLLQQKPHAEWRSGNSRSRIALDEPPSRFTLAEELTFYDDPLLVLVPALCSYGARVEAHRCGWRRDGP